MKKVVCTLSGLMFTLSMVGQSRAQQQIDLAGSDTLFSMVNYMLTVWPDECGGDAPYAADDFIAYIGGGSSTGEKAMLAGSQDIAPMSRALKSSACAADPSYSATAEALAHSLDAISLYRSANSLATADTSCTSSTEYDCESTANESADFPTPAPLLVKDLNGANGLQCPGCDSGNEYTFADWKDVLALAYGGKHNDGTIDCASDVRYSLAGLPSLPANGGVESSVDCETDCWENFFMKDDGLNCTDEPCNVNWHIWRRGDLSGTTDTFKSLVGIKSFCNGAENEDNDPIRRPVSDDEDIAGRKDLPLVASPSLSDCTASNGADVQVLDGQPTLGWLLPIVVPPSFKGKNTNPCLKGNFNWFEVPFATSPICDDGSPSVFGHCLLPLDEHDLPGCVNMVDNFSEYTPLNADTRATNMVQRDNTGKIVTDELGKDVMHAYYNIHAGNTVADNVSTCNHDNSTEQIICLSVASPCTIGFAGMSDQANSSQAFVVEIDNVEPTVDNIRSFDYPLTRYLWLNSLVGFSAAETNQQALASCFQDREKVDEAATASGFVTLTPGPETVPITKPCP